MTISILNYQMGNIQSVARQLERLGATVKIMSTASEVLEAEKIILPGVGHFGKAMAHLHDQGLVEALNKAVLEKGVPILGICLGMQLMCAYSEEGNVQGLGWFEARVTHFQIEDKLRYKVPHTGWNTAQAVNNDPLFRELSAEQEFYFVHAYLVQSAPSNEIMSTTTYEKLFISGLSKGNIMGVQFHPEKSHAAGAQLIRNFIAL